MSEENLEQSTVNVELDAAIAQGWKPKEEFEGNADTWVDYPEFLRRGELFDAIKKSNKEVKELRKTLDELSQHHKKTLEAERKSSLEELKRAKAEALREGEHEKVVEIDEQIAEVRTTPVVQEKTTPKFDTWVKDNSWYTEDKALRAFANGLVQELIKENPGMDIDSIFDNVTSEVKQQFPQKFLKKTTKVLSGNGSAKDLSGKTFGYSELSAEEKTMHDRFVRRGVMTSDDYLKQIKSQRQAKG